LSLSHAEVVTPDPQIYTMLQARIHAHKLVDAYYQHVDGTSVSVAIASSIVAQIVEANPGLTPQRIKAILTDTAKRLPGVPAEQQGSGMIDAAAAVEAALGS
jgi:serine protease AprX